MSIKEIRAIEMLAKAVELGSLRQAAAAQDVTPQAASKAVAQLEESLGVRLLHRTTRSLALTDEGKQLLEATQPAIAALERALERARSAKGEIAGSLRIVGPRSSFASVLWPVVDEFCREHPDIHPDVHLDDGIGDWVMDRVDVGFRFGLTPEEGVIARPLFAVQLIVCASPRYLERYGVPRSLDELTLHRCSMFRHPATGKVFPWYMNVNGGIRPYEFPPTLTTNDAEFELQATLAGQVIAQLSSLTVAPLIRDGRLLPLFPEHVADQMRLFAYYGSRREQPVRTRKFIDLAVERFTDNRQLVLASGELAAARADVEKLYER